MQEGNVDRQGDVELSAVRWSPHVADMLQVLTVAAFAVAITLHQAGPPGQTGGWQTPVVGIFAVPVYALAVAHPGSRKLLVGPAGVLAAIGTSWALASVLDVPWQVSWAAIGTFLAVWAPWPDLDRRHGEVLLWLAAFTPITVLLLGPPVGDFSWLVDFVTLDRIGENAGTNEVGITSSLASVAVLALRTRYRAASLLWLQGLTLSLAAAAGTRSAMPTALAAGLVWWIAGRARHSWRGGLLEALPWLAYLVFAAGPILLRTYERLEQGIDEVSSGRWQIWQAYADIAGQSPWAGHGFGHTVRVIEGANDLQQPPHNVPLELVVELGLPATLVALFALAALLVHRGRRITGPDRYLLRIPIAVLLPCVFLLDHPLRKASLAVPVLVFSAAAAGWGTRGAGRPLS